MVNPPEKLIPWLFCEDSLTEKLRTTTGDASIKLLKQDLCSPDVWAQNESDLNDNLTFTREILMYSHDVCCWYARTIASESTFKSQQDFFSRLEKNALHVMLFEEKLALRQSMQCYSISYKDLEFAWVRPFLPNYNSDYVMANLILWVRCACFLIDGKSPFYLVEIFLPQFWDVIK